jgi:hypothetical protein
MLGLKALGLADYKRKTEENRFRAVTCLSFR